MLSGRLFDAFGAHALLIPGCSLFVLSLMLTSCKSASSCGLAAQAAEAAYCHDLASARLRSPPLTPVCKEYYQFMLCQGILFGVASALIFNTIVAVPSHWFARRRALAIGIMFTGSGMGGTLWPIAIRRMIEQIGESCVVWRMGGAG